MRFPGVTGSVRPETAAVCGRPSHEVFKTSTLGDLSFVTKASRSYRRRSVTVCQEHVELQELARIMVPRLVERERTLACK